MLLEDSRAQNQQQRCRQLGGQPVWQSCQPKPRAWQETCGRVRPRKPEGILAGETAAKMGSHPATVSFFVVESAACEWL